MHIRFGKSVVAAILLASCAIAAYWYWSPFIALHSMQTAAQARDADAFNAQVDYPRVRASLKTQLAAKVDRATGSSNPLAALGTMMGLALADQLVDAMVRPEMVMRAMASGQFAARQDPAADGKTGDGKAPAWAWIRVGTDKVIAFPDNGTGAPSASTMQIVFERSGFASWKITGLRMPATGM